MAVKVARNKADFPADNPSAVTSMAASPGNEEAVMRGIATIVGLEIPIIGGSAADNTIEGKWHIFANQTVMDSGVVVTVLFSDLPIGYSYGNGYRPTVRKAIVTKAEGRVLHELDGQKAVDVYAGSIGENPANWAGCPSWGPACCVR